MNSTRWLSATTLVWLSACAAGRQDVSTTPYPLYRMGEPPPVVSSIPPGVPAQGYVPPTGRPTPSWRYPSAWYPARGMISPKWTTIVLHHSATRSGGARSFDKHHRESNGWDELGYHFVIGNGTDTPDGFVEVGSRWYKQKHGAHCKTPNNYFNDHGIGICLVGDFTRTPPTPRQIAATRELVRFLSETCRIPASRVTTHGAITRKTQCPGPLFPLGGVQSAALGTTGSYAARAR